MTEDVPPPGKPFKSRYGGGWQDAAQFLAEGMCARKGRKNGIDLPNHFWSGKFEGGYRWAREYQLQVRHATSLLKLYSPEAIMRALRTKEGQKIYSLAAPWLDPLVMAEQEKMDRQKEAAELQARVDPKPEVPAAPPPPAAPRPTFVPKTTLGKLKGL